MRILQVATVLVVLESVSFAALGQFEFVNSTGKEVHVFAKKGSGLEGFRLKAGEKYRITNDTVKWGWRFHPPPTDKRNTDGSTPCSASVPNDEMRVLPIKTADRCYID